LPPKSNICLSIQSLAVFRSDLPLFEPVSLSLSAGNAIQISGTNGSGKTSLLRCVCGISHRHQGAILWNNENIESGHTGFYDQLLYVGHSLGLKPKLTVEQNLKFYRSLRFPKNDSIISEALTQLNIAIYHDEQVGNLSAGQKRRVSLARLITEPVSVWILDEPMVALDLAGQSWLENSCNQHIAKGGIILLTSHQKITGINGLLEYPLKQPDIRVVDDEVTV